MMMKSKEEMKGCYFVVVLGRKALKRRIEGLGMSKKRTGTASEIAAGTASFLKLLQRH